MCFGPQRWALFPHRNFQKSSEPVAFFHFWLQNVLRATMACTFSTSELPKMFRTCGDLTLFTSKCASRHNGVQFFIAHLPRCLRTCRFSEPTFRPSGATKHWKKQWFATFLPFRAPASYLFWLSPSLIFSISYLLPSDSLHVRVFSWHRFFLAVLFICPYCRKFLF